MAEPVTIEDASPELVAREPRFFVDHGMIHDRVTGRHVTTEPDEDIWNGGTISDCLALLNELNDRALLNTRSTDNDG